MTRLPDPDAVTWLRAELAGLDSPPMPPDVAARIAAALAAARGVPDQVAADPTVTVDTAIPLLDTEAESTLRSDADRVHVIGAVPDPGEARPLRTHRRLRAALPAGLAAAAVVAVAAVVVAVSLPAGPRRAGEESELQAAGASALGAQEAGPLADPALRSACLVAAGIPEPGATLLGGRPYAVDGRPGTLLVLGTEVRGRFRLVVVEQGCGPGGGRVLAGGTAGR